MGASTPVKRSSCCTNSKAASNASQVKKGPARVTSAHSLQRTGASGLLLVPDIAQPWGRVRVGPYVDGSGFGKAYRQVCVTDEDHLFKQAFGSCAQT